MTAGQLIILLLKFGIALPLVIGFCCWLFYRAYKNSDEPKALVIKWLVTISVGGFWFWYIAPLAGKGGALTFDALCLTMFCGLAMVITWRHSIGAIIAKPFMMLYEDDREIEPQPYYSVARARCKRGQYAEAVAEVRRQLTRFPTDFTGQLLLAEIQAEKLNDLASAELTLTEICRQPSHSPRNIALALNTLADWKLKYARDVDSARQALESITLVLPDTEFATLAEQRIAHLRQPEDRTVSEPVRFQPAPNPPSLGLLSSIQHLAPKEAGAEERATELIRHLEHHPQDHDARERLALLYADEFHRLDLAVEQLEQLISAPNQPARQLVRWLNLVADLQIRVVGDLGAAKHALERLMALYPDSAAANLARNRIELLPLELKSKEKSQTVRLGSYEQNIGLKR
jgi:outer membrane protein assembly factor BamD (BamD/ComL family)